MSGLISGPGQPGNPPSSRRNILSGGLDTRPGEGRTPDPLRRNILAPPPAAAPARVGDKFLSAGNELFEEPFSPLGDLLASGRLEADIGGGEAGTLPVARVSEANRHKAPTNLAQATTNRPSPPRPAVRSGVVKASRKSRSPAGLADEPGALLGGEGLIFDKSDEAGKVRKLSPAILDAGPPTDEVIDEFAMFKKLDFDLNGPTQLAVIANNPVAIIRAQSVIGETERIRERLFPKITPHGN